jgi:hypothetical protein
MTALLSEVVAPFLECSDVDTKEREACKALGVKPRESLTSVQLLRHRDTILELEPLKDTKRTQIGKDGKLYHTTEPRNRVTWKSTRSLLRQGTPKDEDTFVRVTSLSKRRRIEKETPAVIEVPQNLAELPEDTF